MKLRKYRFQLPLHENTVRFFKLVYFLKRKACGYSGSLAFANEKPVITHETRLFVFIGRITLLFFGGQCCRTAALFTVREIDRSFQIFIRDSDETRISRSFFQL